MGVGGNKSQFVFKGGELHASVALGMHLVTESKNRTIIAIVGGLTLIFIIDTTTFLVPCSLCPLVPPNSLPPPPGSTLLLWNTCLVLAMQEDKFFSSHQ